MKKLFSILAIFLFALAATFAQSAGDKIISVENFNEPWIIGTWTLNMKLVSISENQETSFLCEIPGHKDTSIVKKTLPDGTKEEETLAEFKQIFTFLSQLGKDFFPLEAMGAIVTGSPNLFLNDSKTKVFYNYGIEYKSIKANFFIEMVKH